MKILIVGNRMVGDALDSLHAIHSLLVYYKQQKEAVQYDFLGYRYSVAVHEALLTELGLKFANVFFLDSYIKHAKREKGAADGSYPSTQLSWRALRSLYAALRAEKYDIAFILPGGFIFGWITFWARIPERVGHRTDGRRFLLTRTVPSYKTCPNYENFANILKLLITVPPFVPYIPRKKSINWNDVSVRPDFKHEGFLTELRASVPLKRYYVIASQASEPWRMWDKFPELARYLEAEHHLIALWVGVKAEYETVETLRQGMGINLCGMLSWDNLLAVLGRVRFLITNDTGIAHIGTLFCETFIIFGPSNPVLAAPYACDNYLSLILPKNCSIPPENRKMKRYRQRLNINQISLSDVTERIEEKLNLI